MTLDELLNGKIFKHSIHHRLEIKKSTYTDQLFISNNGVWLCNIEEINEEYIKVFSFLFDQKVETTVLLKDLKPCN